MSDIIRLGSETIKKKWAGIGEQLKRLEKMPLPIRVLASPKTTAVLGTTLGMVSGGILGLPTTFLGGAKLIGGVALGEGLIQASPKVEEFAKRKLQPEKVGKYLGGQIEEFGKEKKEDEDKTIWERTKEGLKKAGLIGGGLALAGATALGVSKAVPYVKKKLAERKAKVGLIEKDEAVPTQPPYLSPAFAGYPPTISPMGAPQQQITRPPIQNIIQIQVKQ